MLSCARATRGLGRPSLDTHSWDSTRPVSLVPHVSRQRNTFLPACPSSENNTYGQNRFLTHIFNVFFNGPSPTAALSHFCFATI